MILPPEIFTIVHPYLHIHDISSLVLTCREVNRWVDMNDIIREYYLVERHDRNIIAHVACNQGYINLLMYLHRIKTTIQDEEIIWASLNGHLPVVEYLCSIGADPRIKNNTPIGSASSRGHLPVVKYLHSVGADPTADDNYAIRWASSQGHLPVVKYLCTVGADPTACNNYAIIWASHHGHPPLSNTSIPSALIQRPIITLQ